MTWTWFGCLPGGGSPFELTTATERKVTWRLRAGGEGSVTMPSTTGPDDQSRLVEELRTDLVAAWNGRALWRGRFGPSEDDITDTAHGVVFGAGDYRTILTARRFALEPLSWPDVDIAAAAWNLIDYTQRVAGLPGGHLGIGRGEVATIGDADVEVPSGEPIGKAIDDLGARWPGFDWWVDADLAFNAVPFRGTQRDFPLVFGETVTAAGRTFDSSTYANAVHLTGAEGLEAAVELAPDLGTDARREGRWEAQVANTDLTTQAMVNASALGELRRAAVLAPSWTFTLAPGVWTPDDLWVGDLTRVVVRSGRLDVDAVERITEITVTDTGDGEPVVELIVSNTLRSDVEALLRSLPSRLNQLARR